MCFKVSLLKRLFIVSGLPASGKSTFTKRMIDYYTNSGLKVFIYSTDDYLENKAKELNLTYNDVFNDYIVEATNKTNDNLKTALDDNVDIIIWDQTNLSLKKREKINKKIPLEYIRSYHVFLPPTLEHDKKVWMDRLTSREGKTIPLSVLENMLKVYEIPGIDTDEYPVVYYGLFGKISNQDY
jgi:tRNA uridine 5-carbamoylmethylation protein Kti12